MSRLSHESSGCSHFENFICWEWPFLLRSGTRHFRGWRTSRRSMRVTKLQTFLLNKEIRDGPSWFYIWGCSRLSGFSSASRPHAAEAGELLPHHHRQADQPLHPLHRQSQGETRAQVSSSSTLFSLLLCHLRVFQTAACCTELNKRKTSSRPEMPTCQTDLDQSPFTYFPQCIALQRATLHPALLYLRCRDTKEKLTNLTSLIG